MTYASLISAIDLLPGASAALAFVAITALMVGAELVLRRLARRHYTQPRMDGDYGRQPTVTAARAQRLYERVVYVLSPAVVASLISVVRNDDPVISVLVSAAIIGANLVFLPAQSPLHLMPVARVAVRFVLPAAGIALVLLPGLASPWQLTPERALPLLLAAWLIIAFGMWLERSFAADRPVRMAVIGSRSLALKLATEMRELRIRDYKIVGYIAPAHEAAPDESLVDVLPWLGDMAEIREIVQIIGIDLIAVGPDSPRLSVFEHAATACLDLPVRMIEQSALYEDVLGHVPIGQINSAWFQCIMHPRYSPTSPLSKRILDLAVAAPVAVLALPLVGLLALLVKLGDGGPAFYRQARLGEQGRPFHILKLRTMRSDAQELVDEVPKDELITSVGRLLRKTHLDELPQLVNVLRGEMTIVGPRPEQPQLVEELARVVPYYQRRSLVRPGVTGWAQVRCGYAGSQVGTAWKICHDLYYVKRRSIVFDLLIILQTVHVLVERSAEDVEVATPADDFILGEAAGVVGR